MSMPRDTRATGFCSSTLLQIIEGNKYEFLLVSKYDQFENILLLFQITLN